MAEALLSASVEVLVDKIISPEFMNFFRSQKLDVSLMDKLKTTLLSLQVVLNDAEEKQITNPAVKQWLDNLRDAIYEAEDLMDEINTKALQRNESQTVSSKVRNSLYCCCKQSYGAINSKMQTLFERLEHFAQKGHLLGLREGVSSSVWQGTPTSSVVDESSICGRDDDRKKLKEYLLSEDVSNGGSKIGVVSIVGMGGLGKTTLAKLLYNDLKVKEKFQLEAWAHISKDFDVCRVTKTLLESVTSKKTNVDDLNTLQVQLQQSLSHKKFLLVLDDIWDASYVDWNNLRGIFNSGEIGSKIIITTRDESVARDMQTSFIYHLTSLASEDCWSLFSKHAFGENNCSKQSNLEAIGREIAKKCDGLPLAAVALGGLLRNKLSPDHWNHVLKSNIWDLPDVKVQPSLLLSYHYLPALLKQCFSYCSIFPKKYVLKKEMVVKLWIAQGLVPQSKSQKSVEKVGEEYFDELVSRSMIQRHSVDGEKTFEMHDLLNDLATTVSTPYYMRLGEQKEHVSLERVRHLSYNIGQYDSHSKFDTLHEAKNLQTFLALPLQRKWTPFCYLSNKVVGDLLSAMRKLRVLSLSNYKNITELPKSIGNLIYLRYLNLSNTDIERLPSETCKLCNLETLLLSGCGKLTELPTDIEKLVNLRHLDISGTRVMEMPIQIAKLQNLQTLSDFIVSKQHDGLKVVELGKFPHLQGKLSILGLQNVTDPSEASQANLKTKEHIDELELKWEWASYGTAPTTGSRTQSLVLERLWPSTSLKNLNIEGYGGTNFPNWLGDSAFGNMVSLYISNCGSCSLLPPLGQLHSLKELHIEGMKSVKSVGCEFYGSSNSPSFQPFPSLETLTFEDMPELEEWKMIRDTAAEIWDCDELESFPPAGLLIPNLIRLRVCSCKKLHSLPEPMITFPSLEDLSLNDLPNLQSFDKEGLPINLRQLTVGKVGGITELGLERLTCLTLLQITGDDVVNTLMRMEGPLLPTSLVTLNISYLDEIECLDGKWLRHLTSLQNLHIDEAPKLKSFPEEGLPSALSQLCIWNCLKLKSLPEKGLPSSLSKLEIWNCPLLEESLRRKQEKEWHKVAHIPSILINNQMIT